MSDAPSPHRVSPSTLGAWFPFAGTVRGGRPGPGAGRVRWWFARRRCPRSVRARARDRRVTRPRRGRRAQPRSCSERGLPSGPGWPREDRPPIQVLARVPRTWFSCALSWRSPSLKRLITSTQGTKNHRPDTRADGWPGSRRTTTARAAGDLLPRLGDVTGMEGSRKDPAPNTEPLPMRAPPVTMCGCPQAAVLDDHGTTFGGSSTPPMPTPPARLDPLPYLGQRPRWPRCRPSPPPPTHRCSRRTASARTAAEEGSPTGRRARQGAHAGLGESVLERQLVGVLERPGLDRLHAP